MKRLKDLLPVAVIVISAALAMASQNDTGDDDASHIEERDIANPESLLETVKVQGGKFMFGRHGNEKGGTLTEVAESFHIGKYLVTQGQWEAVMGENPSVFDGENAYTVTNYWKHLITARPKFNRDNLPVEKVSRYDVLVFANRLSLREGLNPAYSIKGETDPAKWGEVPGKDKDAEWDAVTIVEGANGWRLPTEHQWEFAAKGGTKSAGYKGDESDTYFPYSGSDRVDDVAWYDENSRGRTHEVGKLKANELGLYDMSGNLWEWCFDTIAETGPLAEAFVARGGSWEYPVERFGLDRRFIYSSHYRFDDVGFRLLRP